jgi:hypothetical protein
MHAWHSSASTFTVGVKSRQPTHPGLAFGVALCGDLQLAA